MHAFDTLGCKVVGLRTDSFNFRSQRAIEGLGAKKDGVIRHFRMRASDGTVRDTVIYSILATEWPDGPDSHTYLPQVKDDMFAGKQLDVRGTPTFVINGHMLRGALPIEEFRKAIDAALAAN